MREQALRLNNPSNFKAAPKPLEPIGLADAFTKSQDLGSSSGLPEWTPLQLREALDASLLIDLRPLGDYELSYFTPSINVNFPPLIMKRIRTSKVNISIANFITQPTGVTTYEAFINNPNSKYLVFTDEDMSQESDGRAFASFVSQNLPGNFQCVCLKGGYEAIKNETFLQSFLTEKGPQTPVTPSSEYVPVVAPKKGKLSISVAKPIKKLESLSLGTVPDSATPHTAKDFAQPEDSHSFITDDILIGSDIIPHAVDAIPRFKSLGVTHILNMAAEVYNQPNVQSTFVLKWIPLQDSTEQDMDEPLLEAIKFMEEAIQTKGKVFVHCKAGRSRSVSVVIGYLVAKHSHTLKSAYELVRKRRPGVSPNLGFMGSLLKLEHSIHGVNSQMY